MPNLNHSDPQPPMLDANDGPWRFMEPSSDRLRRAIALVCLAALILTIGMMSPAEAKLESFAKSCPLLLMDFECVEFHRQLEHAGSDVERARIEHEYKRLIEERQQSCRQDHPQDLQESLARMRWQSP